MNWRIFVTFLLLVSISGCFLDPSGAPHMSYVGELEVTEDGGFVMDGEVGFTTSAPGSFDDVRLCFYDDSGVVFHEVELGSMPPERNISVALDRAPKYIVLHSPDFYSEDVTYFYYERERWNSSVGYSERSIGHPSELPVDPRASGCGGS